MADAVKVPAMSVQQFRMLGLLIIGVGAIQTFVLKDGQVTTRQLHEMRDSTIAATARHIDNAAWNSEVRRLKDLNSMSDAIGKHIAKPLDDVRYRLDALERDLDRQHGQSMAAHSRTGSASTALAWELSRLIEKIEYLEPSFQDSVRAAQRGRPIPNPNLIHNKAPTDTVPVAYPRRKRN